MSGFSPSGRLLRLYRFRGMVFFARQGFRVVGIDSNHRAIFFGPEGDTRVLERLRVEIPDYRQEAVDMGDREAGIRGTRPNLWKVAKIVCSGYKGKQARDNIHSEDVARFMFEFLWESTGRALKWRYRDENRIGDSCYSDFRKMPEHYPQWLLTKSLDDIFEEIGASWMDRLALRAGG